LYDLINQYKVKLQMIKVYILQTKVSVAANVRKLAMLAFLDLADLEDVPILPVVTNASVHLEKQVKIEKNMECFKDL